MKKEGVETYEARMVLLSRWFDVEYSDIDSSDWKLLRYIVRERGRRMHALVTDVNSTPSDTEHTLTRTAGDASLAVEASHGREVCQPHSIIPKISQEADRSSTYHENLEHVRVEPPPRNRWTSPKEYTNMKD